MGGQIGIPTANSSDDFPDTFVRAYAAMTYGMRNLWWYAVDFVPIVLSFDVEHQAGSLFVLADAAMGALVPIRDRADLNGGTDAVLQLRAGLAYGSDAVNGGLKLGLVQGVIDSPGDQTQLAAEPFLRLSFSDAVYAEASLTINLDEPLGFAFDDQKIWGLHFGLGVRF